MSVPFGRCSSHYIKHKWIYLTHNNDIINTTNTLKRQKCFCLHDKSRKVWCGRLYDALSVFYWELRILDVVYHCIGPWNFSLSLSRTMSRYTSLQWSINTILADHKSLPYLLLTILYDSSLWRISTQLKFSGKPIIPIIDLVDKSKSFGPAHTDHINLML